MTIKIVLFITLLAYSIIASQSFMYILALRKVQLKLSAAAYVEFRKLIDFSMRANFKYVIYTALLSNLVLVAMTVANPGSVLFIAAALAFAALITDTFITVKGNLPINAIMNTWSPDSYPSNWTEYRANWLNIFQRRQIANIVGLVSLLIGAIFD